MLGYDVERVQAALSAAQSERDSLQAILDQERLKDGWFHPGEVCLSQFCPRYPSPSPM
jgi:ribosomal 50S subunit-associated protein YjgA (DUF615 family)